MNFGWDEHRQLERAAEEEEVMLTAEQLRLNEAGATEIPGRMGPLSE